MKTNFPSGIRSSAMRAVPQAGLVGVQQPGHFLFSRQPGPVQGSTRRVVVADVRARRPSVPTMRPYGHQRWNRRPPTTRPQPCTGELASREPATAAPGRPTLSPSPMQARAMSANPTIASASMISATRLRHSPRCALRDPNPTSNTLRSSHVLYGAGTEALDCAPSRGPLRLASRTRASAPEGSAL